MIEILSEILAYWIVVLLMGFVGGVIYGINKKVFIFSVVCLAVFGIVICLIGISEGVALRWGVIGSFLGGLTIKIPFDIGYSMVKEAEI